MPFWLENGKKSYFNPPSDIPFADVRNLNRKQNVAYKVAENHFRNNVSNPPVVMITGQGGSGKSFVISTFRKRLHNYFIFPLYVGIATFNIIGVTLHSLFRVLCKH